MIIPIASAEDVTIDNSTSIQSTVDLVNDSDTIYLSPGTYNESGIRIDKNITIRGLGNADEIIIDGGNRNSIILVNSVSEVKFFNLTFINGKSPDFGGAIHSELGGQIYVDSCNFINNTAKQNGGAIDIAGEQHRIKWQVFTNYGFLNATNCNFINNKAGHDGGALATYWGNSYVYNSVFKYNYAVRDGGALRVGIYSTTFTENCIFENNTAKEWGGALYNWPGQLTVNNCTIANNTAGDQGGAFITSGGLTVTNSKIINNKAKTGGVVFIAEETPQIPSTVIFANNTIIGNSAKTGSLVYVDETTATGTNFNNNYWDVNPDNDEWNSAFITNGLIDMPTNYLDEDGNSHAVTPKPPTPEDDTPQPVENDTTDQTQTTETTENTDEPTGKANENTTQTTENVNDEIVNVADEKLTNSNIKNNSTNPTNIGQSNAAIQSTQSPDTSSSSAEEKPTAHEINKKDVVKQATFSPLPFAVAIVILMVLFGYGYYRYNKNE